MNNYTFDEANYHIPAIRQIAGHWPALHLLEDSLSATAPGYHYALASVSKVLGTSTLSLRLVNNAVSFLAPLSLLLFAAHRNRNAAGALLLVLPLAASNFFVKSSGYVVTDNAALLVTILTLGALLASSSPAKSLAGGAGAAAAVFIRQSGFWLVAPLALRLWQGNATRGRQLLPLVVAAPLLTLALLVTSWGGTVPPSWQSTLGSQVWPHPAALAYGLAVLALLAPAFLLCTASTGEMDAGSRNRSIAWGLVAGLLAALIEPTKPDHAAGRWGGYLWIVAESIPSPWERSLLFLILAPVGGAIAGLLIYRLWRRPDRAIAWIWGIALAFFLLSGMANRQIFHRYYEPVLLMLLAYWSVLAGSVPSVLSRRVPLLLLFAAQLGLTLVTTRPFALWP